MPPSSSRKRQHPNSESTPASSRKQRRVAVVEDSPEYEEPHQAGIDDDIMQTQGGNVQVDRLSKNLVRLALAQELQKQPLKRADVGSKVLGPNGRIFKDVFALSQKDLAEVFGMTLTELPVRDKTKLSQRRAAASSSSTATSKNYILTSILPSEYRIPSIMSPASFQDSTYLGLVSFVVALVYQNGRVLPQNKLYRYLKRMNADEYTPIGTTEKVLQMMQRHGYIVRVTDTQGDETSYDYHLGPRAKKEIEEGGVLEMIKEVYGEDTPRDVERRFKVNVGVEIKAGFEGEEGEGEKSAQKSKRKGKQPARRQREESDDDS
ncbi:MAGE family-domain-containing protein, partial [Pyronema omphalodes]